MLVLLLRGRSLQQWAEMWICELVRDWNLEWAYPVVKHWTYLNAVLQVIGYALIFGLLIFYLFRILQSKSLLLWAGLYIAAAAAVVFSLAATKYGATIFSISACPQAGTALVGFCACLFFALLIFSAMLCHIFLKKRK